MLSGVGSVEGEQDICESDLTFNISETFHIYTPLSSFPVGHIALGPRGAKPIDDCMGG